MILYYGGKSNSCNRMDVIGHWWCLQTGFLFHL